MPPDYHPVTTDVRMSDQGYWIVTVSVAPDKRLGIMLNPMHVTREDIESYSEILAAMFGGKEEAGS